MSVHPSEPAPAPPRQERRATSDGAALSFSIVTAVRNGAAHLRQTLESVAAQTYPHREHLVVDGGSTDGTVALIRGFAPQLAWWCSEPDQGISDAFNKGVRAATGRVLLFLGADDYLVDPAVLTRVAERLSTCQSPYFGYGDVEYVYGRGVKRIRCNYAPARFRRYSCIPHQAMFLDRWFFERYGLFDLNYRFAMDYEHTARFIREHEPQYLDVLVAAMRRSGVSSHPLPTHREMDRVRRTYGLASPAAIRLDQAVLYAKQAVARLLRLNW